MGSCAAGKVDYGRPAGPKYRRNGLVVEYEDGTKCFPNNATNPQRRSTVIEFECPRLPSGEAMPGILNEPVYEYESDTCEAHFTWKTSFACPVHERIGNDCKVTDWLTGDEFDLSALANPKGYHVLDGDKGHDYIFNVCGALDAGASKCEGDVGVCQEEKNGLQRGIAAGMTNNKPEFENGALLLRLTGGEKCHAGQFERATTIEFVCDPDATPDTAARIQFLGETDDCEYRFLFRTNAACHSSISVECTAKDAESGAEYDLSSLMLQHENWVAADAREDNKYGYQIAVCRTLVPDHRYPDCLGAAACQVQANGDGGFLERKLGLPASPQVVDGNLVLEYEDGSETQSGKRRKTRITFFCGRTIGEPVYLTETSDAVYTFLWSTSAACAVGGAGPTLPPPDDGECTVTDPATGLTYDLTPLQNAGPKNATNVHDDSDHFQLSVCGEVDCGGANAGACQYVDGNQNWHHSMGLKNQVPHFVGGAVQLRYTDPSDTSCKGNARKTLIVFKCDVHAEADSTLPEYVDETEDCTYVFHWRTKQVCDFVPRATACTVTDLQAGHVYDLSPLMRTAGQRNWVVLDERAAESYTYRINVCGPLLQEPALDPTSECRGAGICQYKGEESGEFPKPLGTPRGPYLRDGVVTLEYLVPPGPTAKKCYNTGELPKSFITLTCKEGTLGVPVFEGEGTRRQRLPVS